MQIGQYLEPNPDHGLVLIGGQRELPLVAGVLKADISAGTTTISIW